LQLFPLYAANPLCSIISLRKRDHSKHDDFAVCLQTYFQILLVSSQLRLRRCLYLVVGLIACVPLRPLTSYTSGGLNQAEQVQSEGSGENRHPGPQDLDLGAGVTTLPRQKSKCYRNLHQKSKLWQKEQRSPSNQINDRYWQTKSQPAIKISRVEVVSPKGKIRVGCWNVRTLHQTGKLAQGVMEIN